MERAILICCFPRSRSLWLSRFFSLPGTVKAEHDAVQYASCAGEFWKRAESFSEPTYIDCDSGLVMILPSLLATRPLTKTVWIERPIVEVAKSLAKAGFPVSEQALELLLSCRDECQGLFDIVIDYHRLGELAVVKWLWKAVLPDQPFDHGRWALMEAHNLAYDYQEYVKHLHSDRFMDFIAREGVGQCRK